MGPPPHGYRYNHGEDFVHYPINDGQGRTRQAAYVQVIMGSDPIVLGLVEDSEKVYSQPLYAEPHVKATGKEQYPQEDMHLFAGGYHDRPRLDRAIGELHDVSLKAEVHCYRAYAYEAERMEQQLHQLAAALRGVKAELGRSITSKGQQGATVRTAHSERTQVTTSGFAATMPEDSTRNGHTEVPRLWPADTDLSKTSVKLRLTDQSSIVRSTITGSFSLLHASIVLENAFPETLQVARFIRDALSAASLQVRGAENVHARILKDSNYCWQMSVLPRACISIFRAEVKERCVVTVALLFSVYDPTAIVDLVKKLETDFSYIYPRRSKANNDHVLVGSPDLCRPFRSSVIISVARDLYFSGNTPFFTLHQDQFPCHHGPNGDIIWEVPKAMVALVSTAYYAALREWSTGERRQLDFTTNTFVEVYECHIANLNQIEMERNTSYHKMMADIYQLVTNGGLDQPPPSNSVPVLDLSMLED
ncbi:hypothetical protein EDB87DRAFT_1678000 [Lactarius vividus]|nr:hypothetical protein EDB87DRAFT_1678000 [Lactarius vividus]